jgi:D-3-phosphoglycerate dehydrogenase / 2-oxoglutarate reductase
MRKVLIPTKLEHIAKDILEAHGAYTVVQDAATPLAEQIAAHPDAYALIVRSEKITAAIIDALPELRVIIRAGAGYNTIDTQYARTRNIDVMNTPGANANAVAEEVIAMILADARHIVAADPSARSGKWEKSQFLGRELAGKTVGILGLGAIGKLLLRRLQGFEVRALGYDPVLSGERARDLNVELVDLPTLFAESDYISLHIPENEQTRGLVNAQLLQQMKPGAVLVNCARAGVVVEEDLRAAKAERKIRYLNDVYPKDEAGAKPVADVADLMLPHLGANTVEANTNAARRAAEELIEYDEKGITSYVVNRDIPAGLDEAFGDLAYTLAGLCRAVAGSEYPIKAIETSFYGTLKPYAQWLLLPMVAALNKDFNRSMDYAAALNYLNEMGIDYRDREADPAKGFENSITVDITVHTGGDQLVVCSVRGTVAEGTLMVSRINDFDKLYFEPRGHAVIFTYADRPGVLGHIAAALASAGINIDDVRNPHNAKGTESMALLKINQAADAALIERIGTDIQARIATYARLNSD